MWTLVTNWCKIFYKYPVLNFVQIKTSFEFCPTWNQFWFLFKLKWSQKGEHFKLKIISFEYIIYCFLDTHDKLVLYLCYNYQFRFCLTCNIHILIGYSRWNVVILWTSMTNWCNIFCKLPVLNFVQTKASFDICRSSNGLKRVNCIILNIYFDYISLYFWISMTNWYDIFVFVITTIFDFVQLAIFF